MDILFSSSIVENKEKGVKVVNEYFDRIKYILIIALFLIIIFISYTSYRSTVEVIEDKYSHRQQLVEKSILQTINHINDTYKIAEQQLNQEMEEYSKIMGEKYKHNPEVMDWDLESLKEEFGDYEIYILSSDLKIIKTTFPKDLGLDFSVYSGFSQVLRERLEGNSFTVDRLDMSTSTGEIKKYSYYPTHDNKYLLELSIEADKKFPVLKNLDIFGDATQITEDYEMVEEISFFSVEPINNGVAKLRSSVVPFMTPDISETEKKLARKSILSSQEQSTVINTEGNKYLYKFFPALISADNDNEQWNSYVVGIKYNDQIMLEEISGHRRLFLINFVIMILVFLLFILVVSYLLRKFEYQANHDQLTGLANRKLFKEKLNSLKLSAEKNGSKLAIMFLDIDDFKEINDNYGHSTGDKILEDIAGRLKEIFRTEDIISRLGGDEFTVALGGIVSKKDIIKIADKLIERFKEPLIVDNREFFISVSMGISIYPEDDRQLEELIKKADDAMYKAKKEEKDYIIL